MKKKIFFIASLFAISILLGCSKKDTTIKPPPATTTPPLTTLNVDAFKSYPSDSASKTIFLYAQDANTIYTTHNYQGCASIGYYQGTYFAAWHTGGLGEQPGNFITVALSSDGIAWKQHQLIIRSNDPNVRHIDPMFWVDPANNLHLTWNSCDGMWDGGNLGSWDVRIKANASNILITTPQFLFHGCMNEKPFILSGTKKMFMTVSGWSLPNPWNGYPIIPTPADINGALNYTANFNTSSNTLATPQKYSVINTIGLSRNFDEAMVVDLGGGIFTSILRTEQGIYTSNSINSGLTWAAPTKFTVLGATTASRSFFSRLKSGNLLVVLNNSTTRNNLTAYLSTDNGKTWPYHIMIDARDNISYPDVIQTDTGDILLIYDRDRYVTQEINFAQFTENNIKNGATVPIIVISHK